MTQRNWKHTAAHIGALAMMSAWAHGAVAAQTSPASQAKNNTPVLEEIVVSARKFEERLQDAPVAVSTLSGNVLEERGIRDLAEATKLAPSVKLDSDGDVRAGVSIRGVGGSSDTNVAPGVGLFVDGVYQPSSAYFTVPFFDVERMEVLKGPQGTLYGKNTMGGAINIISRAPTKDLGGALSLEAATGDQKVANGVINLPITDALGNRTAVFYRKTDGLQENKTTGENASYREDFMGRSRFVYDANNGFISSLALSYANLRSAPFNESQTKLGINHPIDNVTKNVNGLIVSKYQSANFTNSYDFGAATLTSLTSYDKGDVDTLVDADYGAKASLTAGGSSDRKTFAQELRLADSPSENSHLHWLVGGYYNNDKLQSNNIADADLTAFFGGVRRLTTGDKHEDGKTVAFFANVMWEVGQFEFAAGLRHDRETRTNKSSSLDGTPAVVLTPIPVFPFVIPRGVVNYRLNTADRSVTSDEWQPKVSVSYHFTPDVMAYGLVTRGFRAGGFNGLTAPAAIQSYDPELTTNFETGLKSELFDRRLRLNTSVFYTKYTDIIQTALYQDTVTNQPTVYSTNGGKAISRGLELDAAFQISQDLTVSAGYAYIDIKNDKIPSGQIRREVSGFAPHTLNVQANYLHPIGDDMSFGAHASANYIGKTPMGTETEWRDASTVVDASLDFTIHDITLAVFGKNIFNEQYYNSWIPAANAIDKAYALGTLNQPAQYGVRVSTTF